MSFSEDGLSEDVAQRANEIALRMNHLGRAEEAVQLVSSQLGVNLKDGRSMRVLGLCRRVYAHLALNERRPGFGEYTDEGLFPAFEQALGEVLSKPHLSLVDNETSRTR